MTVSAAIPALEPFTAAVRHVGDLGGPDLSPLAGVDGPDRAPRVELLRGEMVLHCRLIANLNLWRHPNLVRPAAAGVGARAPGWQATALSD